MRRADGKFFASPSALLTDSWHERKYSRGDMGLSQKGVLLQKNYRKGEVGKQVNL